jgi:hypothetical protein
VPDSCEIVAAVLEAPSQHAAALEQFYVDCLRLPRRPGRGVGVEVGIGAASLRFVQTSGPARPFYHFAFLVPADRFAAARAWLAARAPLLSPPGETTTTFDFDFWDAHACYVHDPAGNIVELIAHRGIAESGQTGDFDAGELAGISELGLVADDLSAAAEMLSAHGVPVWFGSLAGSGLAFAGRQAHTLILCPPSRPWLPTLRAAESHRVTATLRTTSAGLLRVSVDNSAIAVESLTPTAPDGEGADPRS